MLGPWEKSYDQPRQHVKKQRRYFAEKVPSSQSYGFSSSQVWMWELDYKGSRVPKNCCFELWCWRRLLRVPWPARRSNQSILKEISPEYSLEGLMLKLKLQSFGHLMQRTDSFEKTWCWERLKVRREGDDRGWDGWMASPTQWTWVWVDSGTLVKWPWASSGCCTGICSFPFPSLRPQFSHLCNGQFRPSDWLSFLTDVMFSDLKKVKKMGAVGGLVCCSLW